MGVNVETFLTWGEKKRLEYLVEFARSIFLTNNEDNARQGWLNLYDTQAELQSKKLG